MWKLKTFLHKFLMIYHYPWIVYTSINKSQNDFLVFIFFCGNIYSILPIHITKKYTA